MQLTSKALMDAIRSRLTVGEHEFHMHPIDYFYLEAEWLRLRDSHPFHVAQAMEIKLFVQQDAPRLRA